MHPSHLMIFWMNSKFDEKFHPNVLKKINPITIVFCTYQDNMAQLFWYMQNFIVIRSTSGKGKQGCFYQICNFFSVTDMWHYLLCQGSHQHQKFILNWTSILIRGLRARDLQPQDVWIGLVYIDEFQLWECIYRLSHIFFSIKDMCEDNLHLMTYDTFHVFPWGTKILVDAITPQPLDPFDPSQGLWNCFFRFAFTI